jgi:peptidoglycan-N-acetylglucosamine deacetylase
MMTFYRAPFFLPWLYPQLTWRMPASEKVLYLTLDDGPVPGPTEFALDVLKQFGVKATFFCIGENMKKNPAVLERIRNEGHTIANHTFNHLNGWKTSMDNYVENVLQCDQFIISKSVSGNHKPATLFRPPYGRITRAQIKALNHYRIVMWDVITYDYNTLITPEACLKNSIKATRPGSIIVFHDSVKAERNMSYALPRFIDHYLQKGFVFKLLQA